MVFVGSPDSFTATVPEGDRVPDIPFKLFDEIGRLNVTVLPNDDAAEPSIFVLVLPLDGRGKDGREVALMTTMTAPQAFSKSAEGTVTR